MNAITTKSVRTGVKTTSIDTGRQPFTIEATNGSRRFYGISRTYT